MKKGRCEKNRMSKQFPTLNSKRLHFRQFNDDDLDNVFKGLSHPDVVPYYGVSFKTRDATKEQMAWFANHEKNKTGIWWAVCNKEDNTFLGAGGLNDWNHEHKKAEIGFWLLPEFWGNGYMTEAMPVIVDHAFNQMGIHRIEGFVETENTICKRAMAKLNFEHEGTMRDCEMKNGGFVSVDIYAALKSMANS